MMQSLFKEEGDSFTVDILYDENVQNFINIHSEVLDSSFKEVKMSDSMRLHLEESTYVFSGMKTFHELKETFPSIVDENGNKKPFNQFLNDVKSVNETYNKHYLKSEYNFVSASAQMAAKWEEFEKDGDRYDLQFRTAGDDKVRDEHAILDNIVLPQSDDFWKSYYPPLGWNCRCNVIQILKGKKTRTPHKSAMKIGANATKGDKNGMFRFNSGIEKKAIPDYNPYTLKDCSNCAKAKGSFAKVTKNELCAACSIVRKEAIKATKEKGHNKKTFSAFLKHITKEKADNSYLVKNISNDLHIGEQSFNNVYITDKNILHGSRDSKINRGKTLNKELLLNKLNKDLNNIKEWREDEKK